MSADWADQTEPWASRAEGQAQGGEEPGAGALEDPPGAGGGEEDPGPHGGADAEEGERVAAQWELPVVCLSGRELTLIEIMKLNLPMSIQRECTIMSW